MSMVDSVTGRAGARTRNMVAFCALIGLFALPALVAAAPPGEPIGPEEQEVVDLVNQERAKAGLEPLVVNYSLQEAAWVHNEHQVSIGSICHEGCGDGTPSSRVAATGYRASALGENVAQGQPNPVAVMNAWMGSPGHRSNILGRNYTDIGVAYNPALYWTQVFARPASGYVTVTTPSGSGGGGEVPKPTATACVFPRDFDGDHRVTIEDVGIVKLAFMATPSDPRWDPAYDVVADGVVDVHDIFDVLLAVGESGC
jgi:hypothetical protein